MFCSNCGEELDEASNFCANCGRSLQGEVENKKQYFPKKTVYTHWKKHKENIAASLIFLLILVGLFFGGLILKNSNSNSSILTASEMCENYGTAFMFDGAKEQYCLAIRPFSQKGSETVGVLSALNPFKKTPFKELSFEIDSISGQVKFIADGYSEVITPQVWEKLRHEIKGNSTPLQPPFTDSLSVSEKKTKVIFVLDELSNEDEMISIANKYISKLLAGESLLFEAVTKNGSVINLQLRRSYPIFRMRKELDEPRKVETLYIETVKKPNCDIVDYNKSICEWHETSVLEDAFKTWFTNQELDRSSSVKQLTSSSKSSEKVIAITSGSISGLPTTYGWNKAYQINSESYKLFLQDCGARVRSENNNKKELQAQHIVNNPKLSVEEAQKEARTKYPIYNSDVVCPQRYVNNLRTMLDSYISSDLCVELIKRKDDDFAAIRDAVYSKYQCQ